MLAIRIAIDPAHTVSARSPQHLVRTGPSQSARLRALNPLPVDLLPPAHQPSLQQCAVPTGNRKRPLRRRPLLAVRCHEPLVCSRAPLARSHRAEALCPALPKGAQHALPPRIHSQPRHCRLSGLGQQLAPTARLHRGNSAPPKPIRRRRHQVAKPRLPARP